MESYQNTNSLSDSDSDLSSVMEVDWPGTTVQELDEGHAQLALAKQRLRHREQTDYSPYLAPWQVERQRRRLENQKLDDETEDEGASTDRSTPPPENGVSMLLRAAVLIENIIPCNAFGCPIKEPHPEGLYRFPGEVSDSALANAFFAPSIPPPSIVTAFNKIVSKPSLNDLYTKDYFFKYHTAPCRPSLHLSKVGKLPCKSKHCGVRGQYHHRGLYLHDGLDASYNLARRVGHIFGIANPPPEIWASGIRCARGTATHEDYQSTEDFIAHHVRLEDDATDKAEFLEMQRQRRAQRP
ncbi:MAG: hypothetical protein Q9170_002226 [Blastenia crenularia]